MGVVLGATVAFAACGDSVTIHGDGDQGGAASTDDEAGGANSVGGAPSVGGAGGIGGMDPRPVPAYGVPPGAGGGNG